MVSGLCYVLYIQLHNSTPLYYSTFSLSQSHKCVKIGIREKGILIICSYYYLNLLPLPFPSVLHSILLCFLLFLLLVKMCSLNDIFNFKCSCILTFAIYITWSSSKQLKNASFQAVSGRYTSTLERSSVRSCCFVLWSVCFCFVLFLFSLFFLLPPPSIWSPSIFVQN